ncbi:MAG TPA: bifunctional diguanylate cyclase/phosphodiesterase [Aestuariivirgaceae bacterium]|jgi:diguanylate cyclase (GGDEF)-like protein
MKPATAAQSSSHSLVAILILVSLLVLGGTGGVVFYALSGLASRTNQIDNELTGQAARAALRAMEQRVRDINSEFSRSDNLSAPHRGVSLFERRVADLCAGARFGVNFDLFLLVSDQMRNLVGCIDGKRVRSPPNELMGRALAPIIRDVAATYKRNTQRSGFMLTKVGIAAVSVGPAWWSIAEFGNGVPNLLVIGKRLDDSMVKRMGRDFSITGLKLATDTKAVNAAAAIREPDGRIIGGLAWSPRQPGDIALGQFLPTVYANFMFLTVAFAGMVAAVWISFRAVQDSNRQSAHAAVHDALTGLANRAALVSTLESLAGKGQEEAAVIYIDLDGFKEINDFYGHEMGDRLLKGFAAGLAMLVGSKGLVARVGGDEFVILVIGNRVERTALSLASSAISLSSEPLRVDAHDLKVAASVGVAIAKPQDLAGEELLRRADIAMYDAKRKGGCAIAVYSGAIDAELKRRLQMADDIRAGLKAGEFWIACQPIVRAGDLKPVAMEVLARWTRADGTTVDPRDFISVAEEHGIIDELGKFVLEEACTAAKRNRTLRFNVNISALQMRSLAFLDLVDNAIIQNGLSTDQLQIEMTESRLLLDGSILMSVVEGLKTRGIRLILDDFGTGYASIAYLRQFQFDAIKLDKTICAEVGKSVNSLTMAQGMVLVAKAAGLEVVAEGIETKEQANLLKLAGCTFFQGYLFGPPQAAPQAGQIYPQRLPTG